MSGLQWFRLYTRAVDDEALRLLAFEDRWHFIALCCLKGSGLLDEPQSDIRDRKIAVKLGVQVRELEEIARRLKEVGLVDETLKPVAWDRLQYKSDTSTERVKKHREKQQRNTVKRSRNVSVTPPDTDTDTDTEQKEPKGSKPSANKKPWADKPNDVSEEVWCDFVELRKRRRAPLTDTAVKTIRSEASKAGMSLEDALAEASARGWQGFKAQWMEDKVPKNIDPFEHIIC